eukprot:PhF_6_TR21961/c0_g1_i1/m.31230
MNLGDEYRKNCTLLRCKINSGVLAVLSRTDVVGLEVIDLSDNYVGRTGVVPLLQTLRGVSSLRHLNLSSNYLTNDSVRALCTSLNGHQGLQYIDLSSNPISHSSGKYLRAFLNANPNVKSVRVHNTLMNPALRRIIERKALENSRTSSAATCTTYNSSNADMYSPPRADGSASETKYGISILQRSIEKRTGNGECTETPTPVEGENYYGIRILQAASVVSARMDTDQWYALELVWKLAKNIPGESPRTVRTPSP